MEGAEVGYSHMFHVGVRLSGKICAAENEG
jgi:hypothetical protein